MPVVRKQFVHVFRPKQFALFHAINLDRERHQAILADPARATTALPAATIFSSHSAATASAKSALFRKNR